MPKGSPEHQAAAWNLSSSALHDLRDEFSLRREFFDRLLLRVSKYSDRSENRLFQEFLHEQLVDMAGTELRNPNPDMSLWRFISYLSMAVKAHTETHEDLIGFMESYLEFSTIRNPKTKEAFFAARNYTNGVENMAGKPVAKDQIGEAVENSLRQIRPL